MQSSVAELNDTRNSLIQQICILFLVEKLWLNHWELPAIQCHLFPCIKLEKTFNLKSTNSILFLPVFASDFVLYTLWNCVLNTR